jgi:ferredoxin
MPTMTPDRTKSRTELIVDRIACDGFGMCAELLPELIELDDWGYPIVRAGGVPDQLLDHARRAVNVCPVLALRLARPSTPPARRSMRP